MEAAFYLFIGTLLQAAFRSLQKRCFKPTMVVACGIWRHRADRRQCLLAQAAPQDMYDLTASRPLLSLAAAALAAPESSVSAWRWQGAYAEQRSCYLAYTLCT